MKYFLGVLLTLFLVGCGGGGGSSSNSMGVNFTYSSDSPLVKNSVVSFSSSVINVSDDVKYFWDFGDGSSSVEANPTHSFSSSGEIRVALSITDGDKTVSTVETITIYEGVFSTEKQSSFQSIVDDAFSSQTNKAGVSVAVYKNGYPSWTYVTGKRSESGVVTTDTPFVLYSITKSITASMILKLIEEGTLSLSDTLSDALGSKANALNSDVVNKSATIEQLLNHTSGMIDSISNSALTAYTTSIVMGTTWDYVTLLNLLEDNYSNVGTHQYANSNYILLGAIIEEKSGGTLEEYFAANLYSNLSISGVLLPRDTKQSNIAQPYDDYGTVGGTSGVFGNLLSVQPYFYEGMGALVWGSAAMSMTAEDVATFAYAFLGDSGSLLSSNSKTTLFDSVSTTTENYGYGITTVDFTLNGETKKLYGHGGGGNGFLTIYYYNPDTDMVVVILTNSNNTANDSRIDTFDSNELYNMVSEIFNAS